MSDAPATTRTQTWVRAGVDYAAPAAFFVGYLFTRDVVQATGVLVVASIVALAVGFAVERRIAWLPLLAGGAAIVFGGLTLAFHDDRFIKIKPTVVNLAFALALLGGLALRRNPLKALLGSALAMPDRAWRILTIRYAVFFLGVAVLNEVVWRALDGIQDAGGLLLGRDPDDFWALWRFPGLQLLAVAFTLTQLPLMMHQSKQVVLDPPPAP